MLIRRFLLITLLLVLSVATCCAEHYTFREYTQADGLRNLNISSILEDRHGFLWVGTQNGLYRYDGSHFDEFGLDAGLPTRSVNALKEDSEGNLWVGLDNALGFFHDGAFHVVKNGGRDIAINLGSTIASSTDGKVYVASEGDLLVLAKSPSELWTVRKISVESPLDHSALAIQSVIIDQQGAIVAGCGSGVCRMSSSGLQVFDAHQGLLAEAWTSLFISAEGDLWCRGASHVAYQDRSSGRFVNRDLPGARTVDIDFGFAQDSRGRVITFSYDRIARWENAAWTIVDRSNGLSPYEMTALAVDRTGGVWLATAGHGLSRWLGYDRWQHWTTADGLQNAIVWAIARDRKGRLWVGTDGGLAFMDPGQPRFRTFELPPSLAHQRIQTVTAAKDGTVWVGTFAGNLARIDETTARVTEFHTGGIVFHIIVDSSDRVWIATSVGLFLVPSQPGQSDRASVSPIQITHTSAQDIAETPDGKIFLRADRNLFRIDQSRIVPIQTGPNVRLGGIWAELVSDGPNSFWTDAATSGILHLTIANDRVTHVDQYTEKPQARRKLSSSTRIGTVEYGLAPTTESNS